MLDDKITNEDNYNLICDLDEKTEYLLAQLKQLKAEVDILSTKPDPVIPDGESIIFKHFEDNPSENSNARVFDTGAFAGEVGADAMIICCYNIQAATSTSVITMLQFNGSILDAQTVAVTTSNAKRFYCYPTTLLANNSIILGMTAPGEYSLSDINIFIIGKNLKFL